ncbi:hypothetical protein FRB96_000082 [Tulasnella sp. 330]|nr:hypothetical protein FRB96_000082 [Tulasnella sp. 330]KAG8884087.1 hypothetical protein FRB97_005310 [Tulasnella sp. 331]
MLVIGLTGGIASGKSSVSKILAAHHIPIVDADLLAREVVAPGTPGLSQIIHEFGGEVLQPDGTLDRAKLGSIIFNDAAKRQKLNAIVHPAVRKAMVTSALRHWLRGEKICVMDVPLLIEAGLWRFMGKVVVVYCSREIQLQRLMKRDGSSRVDATSRLDSQLPLSDKLKFADQVLDNSGTLQDLEQQVERLIRRTNNEVGWTWRINWYMPPLGLLWGLLKLLWRNMKHSRSGRRRRRGGAPDESIELRPRM